MQALESMAANRLTQSRSKLPCRFVFVLLLGLLRTTMALAPRPRRAPAPSRLSTDARRDATPESSSRRNVLAAVAFPVAVGLGSQAPLLGLIANPPDATARDEMLSSWCAADYCTLLRGGAGYGGASAFPGNYAEPDEEAK